MYPENIDDASPRMWLFLIKRPIPLITRSQNDSSFMAACTSSSFILVSSSPPWRAVFYGQWFRFSLFSDRPQHNARFS
ncbi:hypothetical protein NEOLEDRAFT_1141647 [Neolentinus lepideus HHB14362 ss-1]|uniref:Uncharacterized protein n=1 Tax=Neolentinus lepideus HHB14362 ss-1 TaxID=1314782 RepID=A0A165NK74_9AGAM|nr:hypothetical protein NEOLEDRAFT_1141647 [Neolentinus lepideus HHB14362 ss-1]